MEEMKVVYLPPGDLIPYKKNAKQHPPEQVEHIANSIKEFGFRQPLVIDRDNVVVIGHGRLLAAKRLGLAKVPCTMADDLSEEQIKALRLADNKTNESEWDFSLLESELDELKLDFDMADFGFDEPGEALKMEDVQEDDPDLTPPEKPITIPGDIWQLGRHRLMCGDSTDINAAEKLMGGKKAQLLFTDPPYGVDYASKNEFLNLYDKGNRIQEDIANDALETAEKQKDDLWIPALYNALLCAAEDCTYYIASPQGGELMMMMMAIRDSGWQLKHTIIWNKNNHVLGRCDYNYKHEPIIYGWNKKHVFYGNGKFKTSVWDIPKPHKSDLHPTMKPVELVAECILNSTKDGDIVLDIFGGSGTTLIAAEQLDRICYMMELDPKYCDVIVRRWEEFTGKKAARLTA